MVERCVCHDLPLTQLKALAQRDRLGYDELSRRTGCGSACGMCEPYVRTMLITGQTVLPVLSPEQCKQILLDARRAEAEPKPD